MREFYKVMEELIVAGNNILLRGTKVVIPESIRDQTVARAHEGHQRIVDTQNS